jgi:hypothetical protein
MIISLAKKIKKITMGYIINADLYIALLHTLRSSFISVSLCNNFEKTGIKTMDVAPVTIETKGNCINPLENSAKTLGPKNLLI